MLLNADHSQEQQGVDVGAVLWITGQDALDMEAESDAEVWMSTDSALECVTHCRDASVQLSSTRVMAGYQGLFPVHQPFI